VVKDSTTTAPDSVACLVCAKGNRPKATQCVQCNAPMALVTDSAMQGRTPQIVTVIGESRAGKTVYLGFLLDILAQRASQFDAIPLGSFSVELQQSVMSHLAQRRFPQKTAPQPGRWQWACYEVSRRGSDRWFDVLMPDMAGEALAAEIATPETVGTVRSLLSQSRGIILCIDAAAAARGHAQPDLFALKVMSYIDSLGGSKRNRRVTTPVAVVLCKSDYCPEAFDAPAEFARANLGRLWSVCESRFACVEFFASSVVGSVAYSTSPAEPDHVVSIPLHTAPRGIIEPFEWLIDQLP
jgi:hypothetical protein